MREKKIIFLDLLILAVDCEYDIELATFSERLVRASTICQRINRGGSRRKYDFTFNHFRMNRAVYLC